MSWRRLFMTVGAALCTVWPLAAQTVVFKGRVVMAPGGPSMQQVTVSLGNVAVATPNDAGFFSAAVPASTTTLAITVATGNARWVMRYPTGPVPVPRDPSVVTDILVGPSVEETLARDFAQTITRMGASLRTAGAGDAQVMAALEAMRREFVAMTNVRMDALREAERRSDGRARVLPPLSAALAAYGIKANNMVTAFQYLLEPSFSSDSAIAQLRGVIVDYNGAYETLKTRRAEFESGVAANWQDAGIGADLRALVDYALGEIHAANILPLNDALPDVNAILTGRVSGAAATQKRADVQARVRMTIAGLRPRLEELDRRTVRLVSTLQSP